MSSRRRSSQTSVRARGRPAKRARPSETTEVLPAAAVSQSLDIQALTSSLTSAVTTIHVQNHHRIPVVKRILPPEQLVN